MLKPDTRGPISPEIQAANVELQDGRTPEDMVVSHDPVFGSPRDALFATDPVFNLPYGKPILLPDGTVATGNLRTALRASVADGACVTLCARGFGIRPDITRALVEMGGNDPHSARYGLIGVPNQ
jgi:hypothetical protein